MDFTLTIASWGIMVERFLRAISDMRICRDGLTGMAEVETAIDPYTAHRTINPQPSPEPHARPISASRQLLMQTGRDLQLE
jgi:hypothetical protein